MAAGQYKVIRRGKDNSWKYINKTMIKKIKESGMEENYHRWQNSVHRAIWKHVEQDCLPYGKYRNAAEPRVQFKEV